MCVSYFFVQINTRIYRYVLFVSIRVQINTIRTYLYIRYAHIYNNAHIYKYDIYKYEMCVSYLFVPCAYICRGKKRFKEYLLHIINYSQQGQVQNLVIDSMLLQKSFQIMWYSTNTTNNMS